MSPSFFLITGERGAFVINGLKVAIIYVVKYVWLDNPKA